MSSVLVRLLIVVVGARLAAELAERAKQPVVLAEIATGLLLGPSLFGLVHADDTLHVLGELGAMLLLFEAGMHMSLGELRRAGRASLQVAAIGMVVPMALGFAALRAFGLSTDAALFVSAGLTATSVGITARVFGDLRVLSGVEARTVLGAAVADDVGGLLVLAVVLRVSAGKLPSASELIILPLVAVGFVVIASVAGDALIKRVLGPILRATRTDGAGTTIGFALALAIASLATTVKLAPIVGAFVAGVMIAEAPARDEVQRRLAPVGHLLIPLFFVGIGIEADIRRFGDPWVLGVGAVIVLIAIGGKVVSGLGARKGTADRLLIGMGMIPRGEVGLIFASLGLASGALDRREHAMLLLVVFATTIVTPPLLRRRVNAHRAREIAGTASIVEPPEGWLTTTEDEVELTAEPPAVLLPRIALEAARLCATKRPGPRLLAAIARVDEPAVWDEQLRARFYQLLRSGGAREWRFLHMSGALASLLPELDEVISHRVSDPFDVDPSAPLRWDVLERLRALVASDMRAAETWGALRAQNVVLFEALIHSAFAARENDAAAEACVARIGLEPSDLELARFLWAERRLPRAAAARWDAAEEERVLELAAHMRTRERAGALFLLARAQASDRAEAETLAEVYALVDDALTRPDLTSEAAEDLVEQRREAAAAALGPAERGMLNDAPRRYLMAMDPATIALHVHLTSSPLEDGEVRMRAEPAGAADVWRLHVAMRDRPGALASLAGALSACGVTVGEAFVSTWRNGVAIDVFDVRAKWDTDWMHVAHTARRWVVDAHAFEGPIEGSVDVDNHASPWHSIIEIRAADRAGLLYRVASAFARAGVQVHHATVKTIGGVAVDRFLVTGRDGHKLDARGEADLRAAFEGRTLRKHFLKRNVNVVVT